MTARSRLRDGLRYAFTRLILPLLILAMAAGGFVWLNQTGPTPPPAEVAEREWRVASTTIEPGTHQPRLTLSGEIGNPDRIAVNAPLSARVAQVPVADGDRVDSGELLVALDPADYEPPLRRARANLADLDAQIAQARVTQESDRAALEIERALVATARRSLERTRSLSADNAASPSEVEAAEDAVNQAQLAVNNREERLDTFDARLNALEARRAAARADLEGARRDARRSRFEAPAAGTITGREVAAGSRVNANGTLLTFLPATGFEVRALIPVQEAGALQAALARDEQPMAEATIAGERTQLALVRLAGSASARGITGVFSFTTPEPTLRPGMIVSLSLRMPPVEAAVAVPESAVYGNDRVYRVRDGRLERVAIAHLGTTRVDGRERALIRGEGLDQGDRIITTQLPNAVEGLSVRLEDRAGGASE